MQRWMLAMLLGVVVAPIAFAQAPQRRPARSSQAIRAEYAAVLLQTGKYDEAAREYRTLLSGDPTRADYRLALARALAWGGRPRDAERELRAVQAQRPGDRAVTSLLRSTRDSYEPTAGEAEKWVADEPTFAPYRLALARALVREGDPRAAGHQYDLLLVLGRPIETTPEVSTSALLREWAEARVLAGDRTEAARRMREALARAPGDTAIRHALAIVLASVGQSESARAQYDTLLAAFDAPRDSTLAPVIVTAPAMRTARASLLLARARVNVGRADFAAAEADAAASLASQPTAEAHLLLGDLHRWRGQFAAARASYEQARTLEPQSTAVTSAFASLARAEHPALAFAPIEDGDEGWRLGGTGTGDNLGVSYFTASANRGAVLPMGLSLRGGVEYRQLSERSAVRSVDLRGVAVEAAVSRDAEVGQLYGRVGAHAGAVMHESQGAAPEGSLSLAGWYGAWGAGLDLRSGLAYPSLLTVGALQPALVARARGGDAPLREGSVTASVAGPAARADLALVVQRSSFSDGNVRSTVQLHARMPIGPHVSAIYAGSTVRFAERSALYWDPLGYVSNATGLEIADRRAQGFTYALSVLPGVASANEVVPTLGSSAVRRTALYVAGSGDASYRSERWEAGAALSYTRGRAGDYQQVGGSVQIRLRP